MDFDITIIFSFLNDTLGSSSSYQPPNISERFKTGIINIFIEKWNYFAIFLLFPIAMLLVNIFEKKYKFISYLKHKDKEKKWQEEYEQKKRQESLKKVIKDTVSNWTPENYSIP